MKKLMKVFAIVFAFGVCGVTSGWYLNAKISSEDQIALANPCEDDECELGVLCRDNEGGNTGCNMTSDENCKTYGC